MRARASLLLFFVLPLMAALALADAPQTGTVTGTVVDGAGNGLPGVLVELVGEKGVQPATTGSQGEFRFLSVIPGGYTLRGDLDGFQSTAGAVTVSAGGRSDVRLELAIGEEIVVKAELPLVDKFDTTAGGVLGVETANQIAATNRNVQDMVAIMPGVSNIAAAKVLGNALPNVNGSHRKESASHVDGVDVSQAKTGGSGLFYLPAAAVQQIKLDAAGAGAEYGRATGGITNIITRSGTNELRGSGFAIFQNHDWNGQSDHVYIPPEDDVTTTNETTLGGPLVQNRAWFFATAAEGSTFTQEILRDSSIIDNSLENETRMINLTFQPSSRHRFGAKWIDIPSEANVVVQAVAEIDAVQRYDFSGALYTLDWGWVAADSMLLEVKAARHESSGSTFPLSQTPIDPEADPDSPNGNHGRYIDLVAALAYNGLLVPSVGANDFPRDQANAALSYFSGPHDLKFGVDFQDVEWTSDLDRPSSYIGAGFDRNLPGGFLRPIFVDRFVPAPAPVTTSSTNLSLFARDRWSLGSRWTVNYGLRWESQQHDNDLGERVIDFDSLAPRLAAVYDVKADGRLLVTASAGRYYTQIGQEYASKWLATANNGSNTFTRFGWVPTLQRYALPLGSFGPQQNDIDEIEPYYEDEITAGLEWQFDVEWALKAKGIYWEKSNFWAVSWQAATPDDMPVLVAQEEPDAYRDYRALQLSLTRRFADNWQVGGSYTLSRGEGNYIDVNDSLDAEDQYGALRTAAFDPETGAPISLLNRDGRLFQDRTHDLKAYGFHSWSLGKHSVSLGGLLAMISGQAWGLRGTEEVSVGGVPFTMTKVLETIGTRRLPTTWELNLTTAWRFPLGGSVEGELRAEVTNVTNEQEQIDVNPQTGEPEALRLSYQRPRHIRLLAGIRF